jgi:hypothetical protein
VAPARARAARRVASRRPPSGRIGSTVRGEGAAP